MTLQNKIFLCFSILLIPSLLISEISDYGVFDSKETLSINCEASSIRQLFEDLARRKAINYEPPEVLNNLKITWLTEKPITLDEAWQDLHTVFSINGLSIINVNGLVRIVEQKSAGQNPLPVYKDVSPEALPDSDMMIRYLRYFTNLNNNKITDIIANIIGDNGIVSSLPDINACVITGPAASIKAAARLIDELDTGGLRESIQVIQIRYTSAEEIERTFEQILGIAEQKKNPMRILMTQKKEIAYFSTSTRMIADPRTNKIILLGTKDALEKIRHFIVFHLDKPLIGAKSRLHIKELKYAKAEDIKDALDNLISPESVEGTKFFEDVTIVAEPANASSKTEAFPVSAGNRLLIACNDSDWKRIEKFIDKLDKPTATVAMEVMFVEASVDSQRLLSAQFRNKKDGTIGRHVNMQAQNIVGEPVATSPNLRTDMLAPLVTTQNVLGTNFTIGCVDNIWTALKVVLSDTRFNVISQPFLIGNSNTSAHIELTDVNLVTGNVVTDTVTVNLPKVPYTAKISVTIVPKVNLEGDITLNSKIQIDQFGSATGLVDNDGQPPINKRHVTTLATLHNGEVLVLGGLLQRSTEDDENKTPFLGDVPILGNLFKGRNRTTSIKNLYIFIRPTIVKPQFEGRPDSYSQLKLDYANANLANAVDFSPHDPIQRWFFGDRKNAPSLEQSQVNRFVSGRDQPQEVSIIEDEHYKSGSSRIIQARKIATKKRRSQLELRRRKIKRSELQSKQRAQRLKEKKTGKKTLSRSPQTHGSLKRQTQ